MIQGLSQYLNGSRVGRSDLPGEGARLLYEPLVQSLKAMLPTKYTSQIDVVIVHTLNRSTEISRIGGKTVLIYDRYVGQLLNTLNRILYWSTDPRTGTRFFAKVFAEQASLGGDLFGAVGASIMFVDYEKYWVLPGSSSNRTIAESVQLQEVFVFSHEYCHAIMNASDEFCQARRRVADILLDTDDVQNHRDAYRLYDERYPGTIRFREWKKIAGDNRAFIEANRGMLRDELACDDFALHMTVHYCLMKGMAPAHALSAVFLALRHIRALAYIRQAANPANKRSGLSSARDIRLLQARQHRLRDAFPMIAKIYKVEEELQDFWKELQNLNDLHDQQIDLPLLNRDLGLIKKARGSVKKNQAELKIDSLMTIATMLGWETDAETVNYVCL